MGTDVAVNFMDLVVAILSIILIIVACILVSADFFSNDLEIR